jgi:hypothetical protein
MPPVMVRLQPDQLAHLDGWSKAQGDKPSRPEAIRCMIGLVLGGSEPTKQTSTRSAAKASDMAAHQVDKLANPAMPEEERRARKRRLIAQRRD